MLRLVAVLYIAMALPLLVLLADVVPVDLLATPVEERWYDAGVAFVVLLAALNSWASWRLGIKKWRPRELWKRARRDSDVRTRLVLGLVSGSVTSQWLLHGAGIEPRVARIGLGLLIALIVWPLTFMVRPLFGRSDG